MFRKIGLLIGLFIFTLSLSAQLDIKDFRWELTDLAFSYPATWEEPYAVQRFGIESVVVAGSDARNPERAPEIPFIILALHPAGASDLETVLQESNAEFNIQPDVMIPVTILDQEARWSRGTNTDGTYFGTGITTRLGDNILSIIGRATAERSAQLEYSFDILTRSLTRGQDFGDFVPFGIVWFNTGDSDDEIDFAGLSAIALDEPNSVLYAVDTTHGLLQFDMRSGRLEAIIPNPEFISPFTMAVGTDSSVYVGDTDCGCIHVYRDSQWQEPLTDFGLDAPLSILTTPDGILYATDADGEAFFIRRYSPDGASNLFIEEPLEEQPILFQKDKELAAFVPETGQVLQLEGVGFTSETTLTLDIFPYFVRVAPDGTYVVTTDTSVDLYTPGSLMIDSFDIDDYSPGSVIQGLAVGNDNILYIATVNNEFGEILALSQQVLENRIGLQTLAPYRTSSGILSEDYPEDIWLIEGNAEELISLFVQGYSELGDFQFGVTLLAPDGTEIATVTDDIAGQPTLSRNIENLVLPDTGIYEVHVNHGFSQGSYDMTLITVDQFTLNSDVTTVWGNLSESYTQEMWAFKAPAGTMITLTMEALSPTQLDPYVSLYDSQGNLLAQNDVQDTQLGNAARITGVTLHRTDVYHIEAFTLEGSGRYRLTVDIVEPES